ncbi:MAG: CapA family protein [Spirochaetota bacterium]|nr:CapA family protein [Spirochaetota bacterium]
MKKSVIFIVVLLCVFELSCTTPEERIPKYSIATSSDYSMLFIGDMMFEWAVKDTMQRYGTEYPLKKITPFFQSFDFVMANFESPLTRSSQSLVYQKYIFRAPPSIAFILAEAGITAVTLANNHMLDYGVTGLLDTLTSLSDAKVLYAGAGNNEITASLPVMRQLGTTRIVVLCYTQIASKEMIAKNNPGVNFFELKKVQEDIKKYRFCDGVIINIHWGNEYFYYPSSKQIDIAHALIDAGADAVIGHHPHVYQGIEIYKNKPIVYSLGNFLFGSIHEGINDNIACALYMSGNGKIIKMHIYAIKGIYNDGSINIQPEVLEGPIAVKVFDHVLEISKPLGIIFTSRTTKHHNYAEFIFR